MVKKVTKKLRLDLSEVPRKNKEKAKKEVGDYLLNKIGEFLDKSRSPVTGGKFKDLNKEYKGEKTKKGARGVADLLLTGDMQSQLRYELYRDGIEIGVFDESEAQKADNHNKNSAKSKKTPVPQRQFIPYDQGKGRRASFDVDIRKGIEEIIKKHGRES